MATTQERIDNVLVKTLQDGRSIYRVMVGNREYTTFKRDLAEAAKELIGREAEIDFQVKQNGNYTNYYLDSVLPVRPSQQNGSGQLSLDQGTPSSSEERELRIMRQSALARAIETLPYFEKAEQSRETLATLAEEYLSYFLSGNWENNAALAGSSSFQPDDDIPF